VPYGITLGGGGNSLGKYGCVLSVWQGKWDTRRDVTCLHPFIFTIHCDYPFAKIQNKLHRGQNGVFWDVTPCGSCKKRRFGET
jgi:hypothetical protein